MDPIETVSAIIDRLMTSSLQRDADIEELFRKAKKDILCVVVAHQVRDYSVVSMPLENILL